MIKGRLAAIRCFHPEGAGQSRTTPAPYLLDETVEKQLDIISGGGAAGGGAEPAKSLMRRLFMPIVERAGYLNSVYWQLFRKLFADSSSTTARLDLIDSRTRNLLASADARIRQLEQEIADLRCERRAQAEDESSLHQGKPFFDKSEGSEQ